MVKAGTSRAPCLVQRFGECPELQVPVAQVRFGVTQALPRLWMCSPWEGSLCLCWAPVSSPGMDLWAGKGKEPGPRVHLGPFVSKVQIWLLVLYFLLQFKHSVFNKTIFGVVFVSLETQWSSCGEEGELRKEKGWGKGACNFTSQCPLIFWAITSGHSPTWSVFGQ